MEKIRAIKPTKATLDIVWKIVHLNTKIAEALLNPYITHSFTAEEYLNKHINRRE